MGFMLPGPTAPQGYIKSPGAYGGLNPTTTINLPDGCLPGDDVWVWMCYTASGTMTAPAGWTQLGGEQAALTSASLTLPYYQIWRRTFQAGDTKTPGWGNTGGGGGTIIDYLAFIVRSDSGAHTVVTDTKQNNTLPANSSSIICKKFSPTDAANDLRLFFYMDATGTSGAGFPAMTPTDANPSGLASMQVANASINAASSITMRLVIVLDHSYDSADCTTMTNSSGQRYASRSICLNDPGSSSMGGTAKEVQLNQADTGITADSLAGNETDALDAAKGKFVGGARVL